MQSGPIPDPRQRQSVLRFRECVLPLSGEEGETLALDLDLPPGNFVMLYVEDGYHEDTVARATCGLLPPLSGTINFLDQEWSDLSPDRANALRGRIGIVFGDDSWIPYQPVMESMILPQMHHTRRPVDAIRREASLWASRFGLPGLPGEFPASVSPRDRQRAKFARAFIGEPSLILIEHQSGNFVPDLLQILINALRDARDRGAAVLWLTQDLSLGLDLSVPATHRLHFDGPALCPLAPVS